MLQSTSLTKLARLAPLLLLTLTACATIPFGGPDPEDVATRVACEAFEPITWSDDDTIETRDQVRAHNAAWVAVCR